MYITTLHCIQENDAICLQIVELHIHGHTDICIGPLPCLTKRVVLDHYFCWLADLQHTCVVVIPLHDGVMFLP